MASGAANICRDNDEGLLPRHDLPFLGAVAGAWTVSTSAADGHIDVVNTTAAAAGAVGNARAAARAAAKAEHAWGASGSGGGDHLPCRLRRHRWLLLARRCVLTSGDGCLRSGHGG